MRGVKAHLIFLFVRRHAFTVSHTGLEVALSLMHTWSILSHCSKSADSCPVTPDPIQTSLLRSNIIFDIPCIFTYLKKAFFYFPHHKISINYLGISFNESWSLSISISPRSIFPPLLPPCKRKKKTCFKPNLCCPYTHWSTVEFAVASQPLKHLSLSSPSPPPTVRGH